MSKRTKSTCLCVAGKYNTGCLLKAVREKTKNGVWLAKTAAGPNLMRLGNRPWMHRPNN